ncbi:import inner membrane translocase [Dinoroseobacter shibae DFL 12 = DSM 16493]|jgi:predicted lipid-binding transport protein (Tim44 family)|uniref:Import inner membrane translocase n=1 Tax=Dinoroseobacter shibae (strain DSM 16493 / NCIMB 14021 / DFL 12) TaxID=398580 RepID=A8LPB3_DINSH|nr:MULTISPECIES: Tim44/TimA family putative adaptor protein [Dinoroseobacter]ABV95178.1 import inner membrane translocase [Dinoroseobacter shibae DFL 12 = DSM 16493]MDD9718103.1 Tim44/TimA family putative adaptor protein [Dinoroseobacter sp. PD6]URF46591.1 Tim44/TimA family putative adaptor protein [Dinoroseobacter shibae]URF50897.1 Tim44/TimA family putative adaptor protein [Dinoroseobacter shibae]
MNSNMLQILVLLGVAVFLILRLRSVLGTREGFEKKPVPLDGPERDVTPRRDFEVIEGGPDTDITDHVPDGSDSAKALAAMKMAEPGFNVTEFLGGAKGAYEWILMSFENGDMDDVQGFLSEELSEAFSEVIEQRNEQGLTVEAEFVGVRETTLVEAAFDRDTREGEVTVRFVGELTFVVRNAEGEIVEGDPTEIKRQKDVWTFARVMGSDDPNWRLVATGE